MKFNGWQIVIPLCFASQFEGSWIDFDEAFHDAVDSFEAAFVIKGEEMLRKDRYFLFSHIDSKGGALKFSRDPNSYHGVTNGSAGFETRNIIGFKEKLVG